jgi:hypothetical protein
LVRQEAVKDLKETRSFLSIDPGRLAGNPKTARRSLYLAGAVATATSESAQP